MKRPLILAPALVLCLFPLGVAGTAHAHDGENSFVIELTGEAEAPGPGDSDGMGTATLTIDAEEATICYTLEVADIAEAAAAHIHEAGFGVAGLSSWNWKRLPRVIPRAARTSSRIWQRTSWMTRVITT